MTKICKNCQEPFKPKNKRAEFCSNSCRVSYWQQQNRHRPKQRRNEVKQINKNQIEYQGRVWLPLEDHEKYIREINQQSTKKVNSRTFYILLACIAIVAFSIVIQIF